MLTVGVRELKQNPSAVLRQVKTGESITVTEYGRAVARIEPIRPTRVEYLQWLLDTGQARAPRVTPPAGFASIPRVECETTTAQMIADARGYDRAH